MPVDLSPLNPAERRILLLLAQGHTAKSVAAETGASVHSVNERLREARRKTGVGSSRELARLLLYAEPAPQENRDEQIGIAAGAARGRTWRPMLIVQGLIAMTALAAIAAALTVMFAPQSRPPAAPPKVVRTSPAQGAVIAAGPITIEVTFDQPMRAGSYSFIQFDAATYPACPGKPRQSADGRSFALDCTVAPGRNYVIGLNGGRWRNFASRDGVPAEPAVLRFSTR